MTVWQILKTAPFSRLSAAERHAWLKMAFYSQVVALGLQVSFIQYRSDRAPEDVVRRRLMRRLERAEQAVPDRGADAEVHDLSMVMEVMEALETLPVRDAREVVAAMVLAVVHEGEVVVAGIQPEDQKGGEPGRKHEPEQPPDGQRPSHDDEEWRADERSGLSVVLRVTPSHQRGWAVQDPPMHDVLEQSIGHEPHHGDAAGHDPGAGESMEPQGQKCQRRGEVAKHHYPIIGRTGDHPIQGAEQDASGLRGHQFTHSIPIRPHTLCTR